jgi:hypothetical protein
MEMDCKTARYLLDFARPQGYDLHADDQAALRKHLDVCTECDSLARAQHQFDHHLARAIQDVPVPTGLQDRLLKKLRQERDDWWKQLTGRVARYAAVAAALLLMTFGWFYWKGKQLLSPTTEDLITTLQAPYAWAPPTIEEAANYFRDHDQPVVLPAEFDSPYLTAFGLTELEGLGPKGIKVPFLRFVRSSPQSKSAQFAEVYVLRRKVFDLSQVVEGADLGGYRVKVRVRKPTDEAAYVIVYTGDLQDLLTGPKGQSD